MKEHELTPEQIKGMHDNSLYFIGNPEEMVPIGLDIETGEVLFRKRQQQVEAIEEAGRKRLLYYFLRQQ